MPSKYDLLSLPLKLKCEQISVFLLLYYVKRKKIGQWKQVKAPVCVAPENGSNSQQKVNNIYA